MMAYEINDYSIVRFMNSMEDFKDVENPQNNQYYGTNYVHPLRIDMLHRFKFVNYGEVYFGWLDYLSFYFVEANGNKTKLFYKITKETSSEVDEIFWFTIGAPEELLNKTGRICLYNTYYTQPKFIKFSECVRFVDDPDLIKIHVRNNFNRHGFNWQVSEEDYSWVSSEHNWIVTNLNAKCKGITSIEGDDETVRGSSGSLKVSDTFTDQVVKFDFLSHGKARVFDAIDVLSKYTDFFLQGTKVTRRGKIKRSEYMLHATGEYTQQYKDSRLIRVDEDTIFGDLAPNVTNLIPRDESVFIVDVNDETVLSIQYDNPIKLTSDLSKKIRVYKDDVLYAAYTPETIKSVWVSNGNLTGKLTIDYYKKYPKGSYRIEVDEGFVEHLFFDKPSKLINDWNFRVDKPRYFDVEFDVEFE